MKFCPVIDCFKYDKEGRMHASVLGLVPVLWVIRLGLGLVTVLWVIRLGLVPVLYRVPCFTGRCCDQTQCQIPSNLLFSRGSNKFTLSPPLCILVFITQLTSISHIMQTQQTKRSSQYMCLYVYILYMCLYVCGVKLMPV